MSKLVHRTFNTKNYNVKEDGTIYSYFSNRIVSGWKDRQGYRRLRMHGETYFIHRLVATKFILNPENKEEVNHINGNTSDNRVENLEWSTRSENQKHAFDTGLQVSKKGAESGKAVLSMEKVREMRALYAGGDQTIRGLGRAYGVSQRTAQRVLRNEGYLEEIDNE